MYCQDYDETAPMLYAINVGIIPRDISFRIMPYVSNYNVFDCPSSNRKVGNTPNTT